MTTGLEKIISGFKDVRIVVIGDLILDEFLWGKVNRISPEAPVPVVEVERQSFMCGGAANVAANIRALGGKVHLCGIVGRDSRGKLMLEQLQSQKVDTGGVIIDSTRPTTLKTRVIAHHQQVVRVDRENSQPLEQKNWKRILNFVEKKLDRIDAVLVEDYGKGVVVPGLIKGLVSLGKKAKLLVNVDPKENHFSYYKKVTAITPNREEAGKATGIRIKDKSSLKKAGEKMLFDLDCQAVLVTLGEDGMCLFEKKKKLVHIPTVAREVFDVSGAGDTVISAFTLSLAAGASFPQAAQLANCAAGIVVGKLGVAVATQEELKKKISF